MSVIPSKPETSTSPAQTEKKETIVDNRGNIRLTSEQFGVTLSMVKAGVMKRDDGEEVPFPDSIRIMVGNDKTKAIKFTALQLAFIRVALNHPEVAAELKTRVEKERAQLESILGGIC